LLSSRQTLLNLKVQQMSSAVLLIEALGGGWDSSQLPTAQEVTQRPSSEQRTIQQ